MMPFYDYRCECGHEFEVFQSMSDEPLETCNQREEHGSDLCHGKVERLIGATHGTVKGGTPIHHRRAPRK